MIVSLLIAAVVNVSPTNPRYFETADVSAFDPRIAAPRTAVDVEGLEWIDGKDLPLESQGYTNTITRYGRLPADMVDKLPLGLRQMQAHATGHYFLFSTDSPDLVFAWTLAEKAGRDPFIPPQGMYGVDIYDTVNGQWRFVRNGRLSALTNPTNAVSVAMPGRGLRPVLVYLPTRGVVRSIRIGLQKGAKLTWGYHSYREQYYVRRGSVKLTVFGESCTAKKGCIVQVPKLAPFSKPSASKLCPQSYACPGPCP